MKTPFFRGDLEYPSLILPIFYHVACYHHAPLGNAPVLGLASPDGLELGKSWERTIIYPPEINIDPATWGKISFRNWWVSGSNCYQRVTMSSWDNWDTKSNLGHQKCHWTPELHGGCWSSVVKSFLEIRKWLAKSRKINEHHHISQAISTFQEDFNAHHHLWWGHGCYNLSILMYDYKTSTAASPLIPLS